jgi:hypothetical protein
MQNFTVRSPRFNERHGYDMLIFLSQLLLSEIRRPLKDCHGSDFVEYASCTIHKEIDTVLTRYLWSPVTGCDET